MIRANAQSSDPVHSPDAIAFVYVFSIVLDHLVHKDVVKRCQDEIYVVMGELAGIVREENGSSWPNSRKECIEYACIHFREAGLEDPMLRPQLKELGNTWNSQYCY